MYILMKSQGKALRNHPIIKRLIFLKSLLIKLKPIEKKLDYQISKLLRIASCNFSIFTFEKSTLLAQNLNQRKEMIPSKEKQKQEDPLLFKVFALLIILICFNKLQKNKAKTRKSA